MLEILDLRAGYGSSVVLHDISFTLQEGSFLSVLGSNGAGKTTLLNTVTRLHDPIAGKVTLEGRDVTTMRPEALVRLGVSHVPEGRHNFPELTVRENLLVGAYTAPRREATARVAAMLDRLPVLGELTARPAGYLSGGEQQLLAIARALVARPRVLLLDEPTLGLSPKASVLVEELLVELNREQGMTILAVEQNVHSALRVADQALVVESGEVVMSGTAKELAASEEMVRAYIGV